MTLESLITNPFVLRAAWNKARSWLDGVEWAPEPEYSSWKRAPWHHLVQLADKLAKGDYHPSKMELLPYPKKGASIRHRVTPTVEDQVAFMVYGVLLAPFIECRLPNVVFGSRWYRGLRRKRGEDSKGYHWDLAPFSLSDPHLFVPFRRDYALFRRVASWTVSRWLTRDFHAGATAIHAQQVRPEDYPARILPYINDAAFPFADLPQRRLAYARTDLSKAYPSVPRTLARERLLALMVEDGPRINHARWGLTSFKNVEAYLPVQFAEEPRTLDEDPWIAMARNIGLRVEVAEAWMKLLDGVPPYSTKFDCLDAAWREGENRQDSSKNWDGGLPTGLAVSPLLLNVALSGLDYRLLKEIEERARGGRLQAAYLRFADDLVFLAKDEKELEALLHSTNVWTDRCTPNDSEVSLSLAWMKTRPDSVAKWGRCLASVKIGRLKLEEADYLTADSLGEFVTHLVERMSDLGRDRLTDGLGRRAMERLHRLHELVRWDIKDTEVREDTRLAFAANRLAQSWVPTEDDGGHGSYSEVVREIRASVRSAVLRAPWKFGLWRSALRAAAFSDSPGGTGFGDGIRWLKGLLQVLRAALGSEDASSAWGVDWPLSDQQKPPTDSQDLWFATDMDTHNAWLDLEQKGVRRLRVSFLRSHFWRELGATIRELRRAERAQGRGRFKPLAWYSRAMTREGQMAAFRARLENLDAWVRCLYYKKTDNGERHLSPNLQLPSWEVQSLIQAAVSVERVATLWPSRSEGGVRGVLQRVGFSCLAQLVSEEDLSKLASDWHDLDVLDFGQPEPYWTESSRRAHASVSPEESLTALLYHGSVEADLHEVVERTMAGLSPQIEPGLLMGYAWLQVYGLLRRVLLGTGQMTQYEKPLCQVLGLEHDDGAQEPKGTPLPRLLWGLPTDQHPEVWQPQPTEVPALGLPRPWALQMLLDLVHCESTSGEPASGESEVVLDCDAAQKLGKHRHWQLTGQPNRPASRCGEKVERLAWWSSRFCLPPHPVILLPRLLSWSPRRRQLWPATCALLFALEGDESMLDRLWDTFPMGLPWSESLTLQTRLLVPPATWRLMDEAFCRKGLSKSLPVSEEQAMQHLKEMLKGIDLLGEEGLGERVIGLRFLDDFLAAEPLGTGSAWPTQPVPYKLQERLTVRLVQVQATPDWSQGPEKTLPAPPGLLRAPLREILDGIESLDGSWNSERGPHLLMMPELVLHPDWAEAVAREALDRQVGFLSGQYWRLLPQAVRSLGPTQNSRKRFFVNEALLCLPNPDDARWGLPVKFRVRKTRPAHIEVAMARHLTSALSVPHQIVPGDEWYQISHPKWGPFTVAICSDLLDPGPWNLLKGRLLHLFMVAWNEDVRLYDAMTWTRAYELFVNLVAVNHGSKGGSLAWTPAHREARELFQVHGEGHYLTADIVLPVWDLDEHQAAGLQRALERAGTTVKEMFKGDYQKRSSYKSVPPGWKRRW